MMNRKVKYCIVLYLSISIAFLTEAHPPQQLTLCRSLNAEALQQLQVKDLQKVPTWRLERDSSPIRRKCFNQIYDTLIFCISSLLSSLWVSRTGSASDWCALEDALYKCIDTIQF